MGKFYPQAGSPQNWFCRAGIGCLGDIANTVEKEIVHLFSSHHTRFYAYNSKLKLIQHRYGHLFWNKKDLEIQGGKLLVQFYSYKSNPSSPKFKHSPPHNIDKWVRNTLFLKRRQLIHREGGTERLCQPRPCDTLHIQQDIHTKYSTISTFDLHLYRSIFKPLHRK